VRYVAGEMVPLYPTYEEAIKALREWSIGRCRMAVDMHIDPSTRPPF
jgi:hypothetical protein